MRALPPAVEAGFGVCHGLYESLLTFPACFGPKTESIDAGLCLVSNTRARPSILSFGALHPRPSTRESKLGNTQMQGSLVDGTLTPAGKKRKKRIVWVAPANGGADCEGLPIDEA